MGCKPSTEVVEVSSAPCKPGYPSPYEVPRDPKAPPIDKAQLNPLRAVGHEDKVKASAPVVSGSSALVAEYIVQSLVDSGVTHVFGGHGGAVVPLIDAFCKHESIEFVYTRCELNASMAAAAYAKLGGRLACCIGTSGPGASHLTTGLMEGVLDQCPMLCITGAKQSYGAGYSDFQDINQAQIFHAAGVEWSKTIMHQDAVVPLLRDAISTALTMRTTTHVAIPVDIQQALIDIPPALGNSAQLQNGDRYKGRIPADGDVDAVADFLVNAFNSGTRTVFAVGPRAFTTEDDENDVSNSIVDLAEELGVPICTTLDAKGIIPEDHPQVIGVFGIFGNPGLEASVEIIETANAIVSFGVDDHSGLLTSKQGLQQRLLVEIDISSTLLDSRYRTVTSLTGDMGKCCKMVLDSVRLRFQQPDLMARAAGQADTRSASTRRLSKLNAIPWGNMMELEQANFNSNKLLARPGSYSVPEEELTRGFCHPGMVLQKLGPKLPPRSVICVDVGDITLWSSLCLCLAKPKQRMLASIRLGTMGYSLCAAMAAGALRPDEHIVAIAGDGGIQMSCNELATLMQMRVRHLLVIVMVNKVLGRVFNEIWGPGGAGTAKGCDIGNPDFCKLADAYGARGIRINSHDPDVVSRTLDDALATPGLCVLEVMQDVNIRPLMAKKTKRHVSPPSTAATTPLTRPSSTPDLGDEIAPLNSLSDMPDFARSRPNSRTGRADLNDANVAKIKSKYVEETQVTPFHDAAVMDQDPLPVVRPASGRTMANRQPPVGQAPARLV